MRYHFPRSKIKLKRSFFKSLKKVVEYSSSTKNHEDVLNIGESSQNWTTRNCYIFQEMLEISQGMGSKKKHQIHTDEGTGQKNIITVFIKNNENYLGNGLEMK